MKKSKNNKPSKYTPKYNIMPTWEEIYKHWMQPYKLAKQQITIHTQENK